MLIDLLITKQEAQALHVMQIYCKTVMLAINSYPLIGVMYVLVMFSRVITGSLSYFLLFWLFEVSTNSAHTSHLCVTIFL